MTCELRICNTVESRFLKERYQFANSPQVHEKEYHLDKSRKRSKWDLAGYSGGSPRLENAVKR